VATAGGADSAARRVLDRRWACAVQAFVDRLERVLSFIGHLHTDYPLAVWASVERRAAGLLGRLPTKP
jgi:hypothetical protein